jgi:hypothetical protein
MQFFYDHLCLITGIEEVNSDADVLIYPNPPKEIWQLN